jgi:hypothetical protein
MRIVHILPHPPVDAFEGHNSRHAALKEQIPDLELRWCDVRGRQPEDEDWDIALVESGAHAPANGRAIHLAKALSFPLSCDLMIPIGPYEGLLGSVGPLIRQAPEVSRDIDLLLCATSTHGEWWRGMPGKRGGWGLMPRANVVVCAGGVTLYEALWAGCRVVCVPQSDEEKVRLIHATRAGEAVVTMTEGFEEAVSRVRGMVPLGRRPSGVTEAVAMIMAPNE